VRVFSTVRAGAPVPITTAPPGIVALVSVWLAHTMLACPVSTVSPEASSITS
jgi:hypothetical protein